MNKNSLELLCNDDGIELNKFLPNNDNDDIEKYVFNFTCKEDLSDCDIIEIIKNNQLFDLIYNLNNNIINEFKMIDDSIIFLKIKDINIDEDSNKKSMFLCLDEQISDYGENENNIKVTYKNYKYECEKTKQIEINKLEVECDRKDNNLDVIIHVAVKTDICDLSIIDNDAIMIVMKVLFKNLKQYIEPN